MNHHPLGCRSDPSSPFYSHSRGIDDIINNAIDKDHYMFFDPSDFKANRQVSVTFLRDLSDSSRLTNQHA